MNLLNGLPALHISYEGVTLSSLFTSDLGLSQFCAFGGFGGKPRSAEYRIKSGNSIRVLN